MASKSHPLGFCTCTHVRPTWNRSRHWTAQEVSYLEEWYGRMADDKLAQKLGRPLIGVRLKARRLGLRKRNVGLSANQIARIFAIDPKAVVHWIQAGLLKARRGYAVGPNQTWLVSDDALERFVQDHGQYVDIDRMPDSWWRDLAADHRWYSVADVEALTGQSPHVLVRALKAGEHRGAQRGPHWYVPSEEVLRIAVSVDPWRRQHLSILKREREERLKRRRDKRKGVGRSRRAA